MQKVKIPMEYILTLLQIIPKKSFSTELPNIYIKNGNVYGTDSFFMIVFKNVVPENIEYIIPREILGGFKKTYLKKENHIEINEVEQKISLKIKSANDQDIIEIVYSKIQPKLIDNLQDFLKKVKENQKLENINMLLPGDISNIFADVINYYEVECNIISIGPDQVFFYGETSEIIVLKRLAKR